ncbi:MAG: type II toxin-antitoxin system VapC family toxin [Sphingomonadales bacterium]|nr:MAG: type II toxin-antitoxin system VapC family toxin [Sphingomonadales bacterium]
MYLLDTAIVFELRKAKAGQTDPGLAAWASGIARDQLFLSAISLLELETRAARAQRHDKASGATLRTWIDSQLLPAFEGHVLPVDLAVVRRRGQLPITATRDALIAATALEHSLTLVTRDTAAFKGARLRLFNPWGYTPDVEEDTDWRTAGRTGPLWLKNLFVRA